MTNFYHTYKKFVEGQGEGVKARKRARPWVQVSFSIAGLAPPHYNTTTTVFVICLQKYYKKYYVAFVR
jgi:hypothetical protein